MPARGTLLFWKSVETFQNEGSVLCFLLEFYEKQKDLGQECTRLWGEIPLDSIGQPLIVS